MNKPQVVVCVLAQVLLAASLGACAPHESTPANDDASNGSSIAMADWSPDADCETCHTVEQASYESTQCLASSHRDIVCTQCHEDQEKLSAAHTDATTSSKMPKRLKKTEVTDNLCLSCHFGDKESLAEASPNISLTDAKGNTRNPHAPDGIAEHESIACVDCHSMHAEESIEDQAMSTCVSCHHAEVFECYTCHE